MLRSAYGIREYWVSATGAQRRGFWGAKPPGRYRIFEKIRKYLQKNGYFKRKIDILSRKFGFFKRKIAVASEK